MRYALDALRRRPARSAASALGVGLATALVVILLAVSSGVQSSAGRLATESGVDLLVTSANTSISAGTFPPLEGAHGLPGRLASADPNVATASPWLVSSLTFANGSLYDAVNSSSGAAGVPAGWTPSDAGVVGWIPGLNAGLETPPVVAGPGFSSGGDPHYANGSYSGPETREVVLDQALAAVLRVAPGAVVYASPQSVASPGQLAGWYANATAFRVVGVSGPYWLLPSALLGFFYLSELQGLLGSASASTDYASLVLVHLVDPTDPARDQARIEAAFPDATVFTLGNVLGAVQHVIDLYRTFGVLIGAIGVVVATLFTMTVLWMSVDDRSQELAVLRAIGYRRARIGGFVLEEGLLLAALGLAVGVPLGFTGAYALNAFLLRLVGGVPTGFAFVSFDLGVAASALVEVVAVGLAASIAPALEAMNRPVAEELRAP